MNSEQLRAREDIRAPLAGYPGAVRRTVKGFTLIELLVVIAIIAIIAGLLFPALSRAKGRGQRIRCLSNVKQILLAFSIYADGNAERYPVTSNWDNFGGALGKDDMYGGLTPAERRPLYRYAGNVEIFHCPGDKGDTYLPPKFKTSWEATGNSYRTQWEVNSFRVQHVTAQYATGPIRPITTAVIAQSPVNKIILGDSPWHGNRLSSDGKSAWHAYKGQRRHTIGWGDGHVTLYKFPKEMDDPALWSIFILDGDTTSPMRPQQNFYWW